MLRVRQKVSAVAVTQQTVKNCDFAQKSQNYIPQMFFFGQETIAKLNSAKLF